MLRRSQAGSDALVVCALGQLGARPVRRVGAMRVRDQGVLWGAALASQGPGMFFAPFLANGSRARLAVTARDSGALSALWAPGREDTGTQRHRQTSRRCPKQVRVDAWWRARSHPEAPKQAIRGCTRPRPHDAHRAGDEWAAPGVARGRGLGREQRPRTTVTARGCRARRAVSGTGFQNAHPAPEGDGA